MQACFVVWAFLDLAVSWARETVGFQSLGRMCAGALSSTGIPIAPVYGSAGQKGIDFALGAAKQSPFVILSEAKNLCRALQRSKARGVQWRCGSKKFC
jgi:hypothetical protein